MDPAVTIRALGLYMPLAAAALLWWWRRPGRHGQAGMLLACIWNLVTLLLLHWLAAWMGWWRFEAEGALFYGMPVDLYLGWAVLWGAIAWLAFPRENLLLVAGFFLALDLVAMPLMEPVVRLGPGWLAGEVLALALCLVPAQLLARWTAEQRHLAGRSRLQILLFGGALGVLLPSIILENTGGSWATALQRPRWQNGLWLQALLLPVVLGVSAVLEFERRGRGTPLPYDAPQRLVTSGPYAYLANPMQLSAVLLLLGIGAWLESLWVAAAGVVAWAYSAGLAAWDEGGDMRRRFGAAWTAYRSYVRDWIPRWRPYAGAAPARLYVAESCSACSGVRRWLEQCRPVGLHILAAEQHPAGLTRITYRPQDGSAEEQGVLALARVLQHLHLGYALAGWLIAMPGIRSLAQLLTDASGGHPRVIPAGPRPSPASPVPWRDGWSNG